MTRKLLSNYFSRVFVYFAGLMTILADDLPIRGLHLFAPKRGDEVALCERFIREALPQEGVNTLVLEFDYSFQFLSRSEMADPSAIDASDAKRIAKACRAAGVRLIPQINCLGHQSWAKNNGALLKKYPEFDETPNKYPNNEGIYCRSYCPRHPEVHKVLFDLIDELADACDAKDFHVGLDETFIIADKDCPRCGGKNPAAIFAAEITALRDHLKKRGRTLWMWGDRLLDGKATRTGEWEGAINGTHHAIDAIPKDIIICDWHYDKTFTTPELFAERGFRVVASPWRKTDVALGQLQLLRDMRSSRDRAYARNGYGMLQTTWCGFTPFVKTYFGELQKPSRDAAEAVDCFRVLFAEIRKQGKTPPLRPERRGLRE